MTYFFRRNKNEFDLWGGRFLECQLGAYWAVWAHFTKTDEPALVSLPIGTGRTALMMALSFGYEAKRVLVVTPLRLLRDQIAKEFKTLEPLEKIGAVSKNVLKPKVFSNRKRLKDINDWNTLELKEYDVVTATSRTVSPREKNVCNPPSELFDLIFLDEAHHAPAPTWQAILEAFQGIKCILLTSTPYRRDKRTVNAPLVYHYPVSRAIKRDIYRPVAYHPVSCNGTGSCNTVLCQEAKRILDNQRNNGNSPKLLIQTNRLKDVPNLIKLYGSHKLTVGAVTSAQSWKANQDTIQELQDGQLDGLVCAGMMGEGLALPELRIAVLHAAPRSLPFTLQVVGRVYQSQSQYIGDGHLVSVPEELDKEMKQLHISDIGWDRLVPELASVLIGEIQALKHLKSSYTAGKLDAREWYVNPVHLKPFFSVRIYEVPEGVDMDKKMDVKKWPKNVNVYYWKSVYPRELVVVITGTQEEPSWAKGTGIEDLHFDLHIFYYDKKNKLFFEATTSRKIARKIRFTIADKKAFFISSSDAMNLLHIGGGYSTLGLKNIMGFGPKQPSYMTLIGTNVEGAVHPTYVKNFGLGHALKGPLGGKKRGVSALRGGAWTTRRDNIDEFKKWCKELADEIRRPLAPVGLLNLAFSHDISELEERPLAIRLDDSLLTAKYEVRTDEALPIEGDIVPYMEITKFNKNEGKLECEFCFHSEKPGIRLLYSPSAQQVWQKLERRNLNIELEFSPSNKFEGDLRYYLEEFPPVLVMPEGGVIINRQQWEPQQPAGPLPQECFKSPNWGNCDKTCEDGKPEEGLVTIHDWLEEKLKEETSDEAIIIKDHGTGEIADFIAVEPGKKEVTFYHCKAKTGEKPSDRVTDAYDVLGQAIRSDKWILSPRLIEELHSHVQRRKNSCVIPEERTAELEEIKGSFRCNEWKYQVVVVQPGFDYETITEDTTSKIHCLIASTYEWLSACHADFAVWGSQE